VNLVAPEAATNRDVANALGRALRRPVWLHVPRGVLTAALGEQATLVLDGQQVRPRVLEENGFIFNFPGVELALLDLLRS
jgi:NAD dependent epimerase/dehydratase family enzyme